MTECEITWNVASAAQIEAHLSECDDRFVPPLSGRVNLCDYAQKLASHAERIEAWNSGRLVGLVAAYLNRAESREGFVSSVSVCRDAEGKGLGSELVRRCCALALERSITSLVLEVVEGDARARAFYVKCGFRLCGLGVAGFLRMRVQLGSR